MKTKGEQFAGVTVALVTPFRDGAIDFADLNRLVDWHVQQGTDCLSPVGTTGESPTTSDEEKETRETRALPASQNRSGSAAQRPA